MKNSLGIYGAGGFGREIIPMIKAGCQIIDSQGTTVKIRETFFIETAPSIPQINNYQVVSEDNLDEIKNRKIYFSVAIADSRVRHKIVERMSAKSFEAISLIDSSSFS